MSVIKELAKENLLHIALQGTRAVLERELGVRQVLFSISASLRQDLMRRAREKENGLTFPYSYMTLTGLAGVKERQNNYAVQKHGLRFNTPGQRATTAKGYLFPITLGLDFHYIDSDPERVLTIAQALVLMSVTNGLSFQINVGELYTFVVDIEIPLDTTINVEDGNNAELPGATDINVQLIMHTTIGFFRDVAAVNSDHPTMEIKLADSAPFSVKLQRP